MAALLWKEGKLFICQRAKHKNQGLLWEFPGGKIEEKESPQEALKRECQEELNIVIDVKDLQGESSFRYENFSVHIRFFNAEIIHGEPENKEHEAIKWVNISELADYEFCPADRDIIQLIQKIKR